MCEIDVAISFLMLASVTIRAEFGEEEIYRTMSSSFCVWVLSLSFSFLLAKLKEKQSEKMSDKQKPGVNSWWKEKKEGNMP